MDETRDMAIKALTTIENHITSCDRRYEEYRDKQDKTLQLLSEMKTQIDETRGAGKLTKIITGAISGAAGFIGGMGSHIIIK